MLSGARDEHDCRLKRLLRRLESKWRGTNLLGRLLSLRGPQGRDPTLNRQANGLVCCIASTGSCQENPPWRGASRRMDRRPRERCIPDDSRIPRGNSPGDRRPVEMATKAIIL